MTARPQFLVCCRESCKRCKSLCNDAIKCWRAAAPVSVQCFGWHCFFNVLHGIMQVLQSSCNDPLNLMPMPSIISFSSLPLTRDLLVSVWMISERGAVPRFLVWNMSSKIRFKYYARCMNYTHHRAWRYFAGRGEGTSICKELRSQSLQSNIRLMVLGSKLSPA